MIDEDLARSVKPDWIVWSQY